MNEREQFEQWHDETYGAKPSFNRNHEGSSHWDGDKQDRWEAWQARASQPAQKPVAVISEKVGELNKRNPVVWLKSPNSFKDGTKLYTTPPSEASRIAELEDKLAEKDAQLGRRNLHKEAEYLRKLDIAGRALEEIAEHGLHQYTGDIANEALEKLAQAIADKG